MRTLDILQWIRWSYSWRTPEVISHSENFMEKTDYKMMEEAWRSHVWGWNTIRSTSELHQIFCPTAWCQARLPRASWGSSLHCHLAELLALASKTCWAVSTCWLILHFGEKAKLLLEVAASWPRGQDGFYTSLFQASPIFPVTLGVCNSLTYLHDCLARCDPAVVERKLLSVAKNC